MSLTAELQWQQSTVPDWQSLYKVCGRVLTEHLMLGKGKSTCIGVHQCIWGFLCFVSIKWGSRSGNRWLNTSIYWRLWFWPLGATWIFGHSQVLQSNCLFIHLPRFPLAYRILVNIFNTDLDSWKKNSRGKLVVSTDRKIMQLNVVMVMLPLSWLLHLQFITDNFQL